ncbi:hypothetical protein FRC08_016337 [Ceratobasidium sp. 394]|nr:hypothetical protein FRC08_016337 [Ceratobasidium sp. 394]
MCFERATGMRFRLCGCVDIVEVEFIDCLLPSCRQSICHPDDCQGILCPCTIKLGPRVLLVKPPVNRRCEKCEARQSLPPPPTKARRSRHKRDTRERHPPRPTYEPVRELKPKTTKTRTKDVDRPKTKSSRRPLAKLIVLAPAASPVVTETPATVPSMHPSLYPPRPMNPQPPSSTSSSPLEPLPLPPTPAPPPSERRSSFTSESTRPRMVAAPFRSQPSSPRTSSPLSSAQSSAPLPPSPSPKRPKLGWTASTLMAVLPKVPSRPFSQSSREASPVLVEHPVTPSPPSIPGDLKPRPRRSFLRNPWR